MHHILRSLCWIWCVMSWVIPSDHLLLDSAPNLGPLISRWEINKLENCWYKSVRILQVLKLLFQQPLNLSSSQRDMSGRIIGALSNNRWSGVPMQEIKKIFLKEEKKNRVVTNRCKARGKQWGQSSHGRRTSAGDDTPTGMSRRQRRKRPPVQSCESTAYSHTRRSAGSKFGRRRISCCPGTPLLRSCLQVARSFKKINK
jgi:hypothetical protein